MKLTKKFIAVFAALIMLFASLIISYAESEFLISINDVNANTGDEIQFVVELKNNPGIGIITLNIGYDESILTLKEATAGALKKTFNFNYRVDSDKNPIVVNGTMRVEGDDPESGLNKNNGELVVLTFTIAENAPAGNYPLSFTAKYCSDDYGMPVKHTLKTGVLTIEKKHEHNYTSSITEPTCTEKGYTTYTCECGDTYKDNYVDVTGHTPEVILGKAATETETGLTDGEKCSVCGTVTKDQTVIPVLEHEHVYESVVTAPTCSEKGYTTYTCKCGEIYKDNYVDATGVHVDDDNNNKCDFCNEPIAPTPPDDPVIIGGDYNLGDVNDDGKITAADARTILRTSARLETLTDIQTLAADIDGNGKVTASDARIALRISAKLDSIDNYIKEDTSVEEPPVVNPPVEEPVQNYDLSVFFGTDADALTSEFPEFEFDDGHAAFDGVAIDISEDGMIYDISIMGSEKFSMFGVTADDSSDAAIRKLEDAGFDMSDGIFGYNEENGINLCIFENDEGMLFVNIYIDNPDDTVIDYEFSYDMGYNINMHIDSFFANIDNLVQDDENSNNYYNEFLILYTDDDGYVKDIFVTAECDYVVYGVGYGTDPSDVDRLLSDVGFVYDEENMVWYNNDYGEYVAVHYDVTEEYVEIVNIWNAEEIGWAENELFQYLDGPIENVTDVFDELEYYPETEDSSEYYWYDGIYFYTDADGYITEIQVDKETDCTLWGLYIGMSYDDAVEILETSGEYFYADEQYICIDNYYIGISGIVTFDESGNVDFISTFDFFYDMTEYLGCDIEVIKSVMPYLVEDEEYICKNDCFAFYADDSGYITEVAVLTYSFCYIYDVYFGMSETEAFEKLELNGFEYDSTDADGFEYFYNSDEEVTVCLYFDEVDEVAFISAIC